MLRLRFVSPFVGVFTFGCAVLPSLNELTDARPDQIIDHVRCELRDAYAALKDSYPFLENWSATYQLTSKADQTRSGGLASGVWTVPGGWSLGASAIGTHQNTRQGVVKYASGLSTVKGNDCSGTQQPTLASHSSLTNDLGILDWLSGALKAWDLTEDGRPTSLGYSVSFTAKIDASLKPGMVIKNLTVGGTLGGAATGTNLLEVAFARNASPPPPQRVCIVDPNTGKCPAAAGRTDEAVSATNPEVQNVLDSLRTNLPGL